ncbi:hypothetical protein GOODEAATRI_005924, partial [Goodea atripinnis]
CTFHGKKYPDGVEFADDKDPCGVCYCYGGDITCTKLPCYEDCSHPYKPAGQCCGECEVLCTTRKCPSAPCAHPALDDCACGVCDGCNFNGRDCYNGERFPHPEDHCQICSCLAPSDASREVLSCLHGEVFPSGRRASIRLHLYVTL